MTESAENFYNHSYEEVITPEETESFAEHTVMEQVDGIEILVQMAKKEKSTRGTLILLILRINISPTFSR